MKADEQKKDSIVQIDITVEPGEVSHWLAEAEGFEDGVDWNAQEALKSAITARAEYELLNSRVPSPLTRPLIVATEDVAEGAPFNFSMSFAELPQGELSDYSHVDLPRKKPEVTDEEVQKLFENAIGSVTATTSKGEGAVVEDGDTVDIALESVADGKIYHPLTASKRYYDLGSGFMPKDFDDTLRGMKVGEKASVDLKVPQSDMPGGDVTGYLDVRVTVTVNDIMLDTAASVDDAWIRAQFPGIAGVDELKAALRQQLAMEKEDMYAEAAESLLLRKLADRLVDGSVPDAVLELQSAEALKNIQQQLDEQGRTLEEFMERQGMDEQQLKLSLMMDVRTQDRQMMALDAWARHYGLEVTPDDQEHYVALIAKGIGGEAAEKVVETMYDGALEESVLRMVAQRNVPA